MKPIHKAPSSIESSHQKNEKQRVFARVVSRPLSKSELKQVAGAKNGTRECWDTQRHDSIFTSLDCSND